MEEALKNFFTQPLVIGICIGLVIALLVWFRGVSKTMAAKSEGRAQADRLRSEIETLKKHLQTQMEITAKGGEAMKDEMAALQRTNQNLNQTIGALKQKPGRAEIRTLHLYDKAVRIMNSRAPGFSGAWESAINEAEEEIKKEESGLIGWIRKPFMYTKAPKTELIEGSSE